MRRAPRARYWQMLAQLDVEMPVAAHDRKHASRGVSLVPQFMHGVVEMPQIERQDDVLMFAAMHESYASSRSVAWRAD